MKVKHCNLKACQTSSTISERKFSSQCPKTRSTFNCSRPTPQLLKVYNALQTLQIWMLVTDLNARKWVNNTDFVIFVKSHRLMTNAINSFTIKVPCLCHYRNRLKKHGNLSHLTKQLKKLNGKITKRVHTKMVTASLTTPAIVTVTALVTDRRIYSVNTYKTINVTS